MFRRHFLAQIGMFLLAGGTLFCAEPKERRASYAFATSIDATLTMLNGTKMKAGAESEIDYTWLHRGTARELTLERFLLKSTLNGKAGEQMEMSGRGLTDFGGAEPRLRPVEKAPPEVKSMLQEIFGGPLYRIEQRGPETITTILAQGAGKEMTDEGSIGQTTLFHPVIPAGKDEAWESNAAMVFGSEGVVRGKLAYRKIPNRPGAVYAVSGTLTNPRYPAANGKTVFTGVNCEVSGEQTYDEAAQLWQEGKLNIAMRYEIQFAADGKAGDGKGTIVATMKRR